MKHFLLIVALLGCGPNSLAGDQPSGDQYPDSVMQGIMCGIDSLRIANKAQADLMNELSNLSSDISTMKNPFGPARLLIGIFSILMGVCAIIMAFITYISRRHFDDFKKAKLEADDAMKEAKSRLEETEHHLGILNRQLKVIVTDSRNYSEYFLIFFNKFLPVDMRLDQECMKYVLDLASLEPEVRFNAIGVLKSRADESVIPYLEWVLKNRPSSKDSARDAIAYIKKRTRNP